MLTRRCPLGFCNLAGGQAGGITRRVSPPLFDFDAPQANFVQLILHGFPRLSRLALISQSNPVEERQAEGYPIDKKGAVLMSDV
jgi:hypothetical protein